MTLGPSGSHFLMTSSVTHKLLRLVRYSYQPKITFTANFCFKFSRHYGSDPCALCSVSQWVWYMKSVLGIMLPITEQEVEELFTTQQNTKPEAVWCEMLLLMPTTMLLNYMHNKQKCEWSVNDHPGSATNCIEITNLSTDDAVGHSFDPWLSPGTNRGV